MRIVAGDAVLYPVRGVPGPPGEQGPAGPQGPQGEPGADGPAWHIGQGTPPDFIPGAKPGDHWMDQVTGDVYVLE